MRKESLNENWEFFKVNEPQTKQIICLPHDAMIFEKRSPDAPSKSSGGFFPGGQYVYRKKLPGDHPKGTRILLEFEGVYGECFVYVNGVFVQTNFNGYTDFYVDLSDKIRYGEENEIELRVDNEKMINSRWYSGSGLYRPVWLHTGGLTCIEPDGLRISTPDVAEDVTRMDTEIRLVCDRDEMVKTRLETIVTDQKGNEICSESTPVTFFGKEKVTARQRLFLKNVQLWSPEDPTLYTCHVKLSVEETKEPLDEITSSFGIRKIQFDPVHGMRINGKPVMLRGACIHHDNGVIGAATYYDAEERRIKLLKEAGFNAIRISHQPCSKAMLDACDKWGMLVWEETFDMWEDGKTTFDYSRYFKQGWENDIVSMVAKDFNHPSVFIYCIGNEIKELAKPDGIRISRALSERVRQLDDTRPITNAINGLCAIEGETIPILMEMGFITKEQITKLTGNPDSNNTQIMSALYKALGSGTVNDVMTALAKGWDRMIEHHHVSDRLEEIWSHLDVCGYNYMQARYPIDVKKYPNRILVGSETHAPKIDLLWKLCQQYPQLIGDFTWTGWDYIGEAGVGHTNYQGKSTFSVGYPGYLAYCGDMDITGYRRPLSYFREIVFGIRKVPYLSVQNPLFFESPTKCTSWAVPETVESWTWPGFEGKPIRASVFSSDEEVALQINGIEVARKRIERNAASFETIYQAGEITAIGYSNGIKTGRFSVFTAAATTKLHVTLSKKILVRTTELCFVEIQLEDDKGVKCMDRDRPVSVNLDGPAVLAGFGNGDPCSIEDFTGSVHRTFNGRALAVIRGMNIGDTTITIYAEGCAGFQEKIKIVE